MNKRIDFIKTTLLGGIAVIIPLSLVLMVLIETVDIVTAVIDPVVDLLPVESVGGIEVATILAILIIFGLCFLAGLMTLSSWAVGVGQQIESKILTKIPLYQLVKTASGSIFPSSRQDNDLKPAVLEFPDKTSGIVVIIQDHGNGYVTIFIPNAPMVTIGTIRYVEKSRLTLLDASPMEVADVISQWGYGAGELFDAEKIQKI